MKNNDTYKIYTLGCKVNQVDSRTLGNLMMSAGYRPVCGNACLAIINTCAVTQTAIRKDKRMINKAKKENPGAKVVVIGCWPEVYGDEIKNLGVDLIWGAGDMDELVKKLMIDTPPPTPSLIGGGELKGKGLPRSRYFLKIQDGCEQFCSYCIIPYTRGRLKSRGQKSILAEANKALRAGYQEIVLCGIHLGLYGYGIKNKKPEATDNLVKLLQKIIKIPILGRVRLSSIEVTEVSAELINLIKNSQGKICPHLHIPLQSGSDKILKLMNRPYSTADFKNKIAAIRKTMPNIAITTDVIVGFPGETRMDFTKTHNFVKEIKFSRLHVFPFSPHKKTPAYNLPGRVEKEDKLRRAEILRKTGKKLEKDYKRKFIGRELKVAVESVGGDILKGRSEYYFTVEEKIKNTAGAKVGEIVKVKLLS